MIPIDPQYSIYDMGESYLYKPRKGGERLSERGAYLRDIGYVDSPRPQPKLGDFFYRGNFAKEEISKGRVRSMECKPALDELVVDKEVSPPTTCCEGLLDTVRHVFRKRSASDSLNSANT